MSDQLTTKHKDSLVLAENKLSHSARQLNLTSVKSRPFQLILFPIITTCIFVSYWLVLCPLLFNKLHTQNTSRKERWPISWPLLYWLVALLIWILIMITLVIVWRNLKDRYTKRIKPRSYGLEDPVALVCLKNMSEDNSNNIPFTRAKVSSVRKHTDLPPLVIHRRKSGEDVENTGVISVKQESNLSDTGEDCPETQNKVDVNVERDSMKNYLKLVTITPSEDEIDTPQSSERPLSPRELFFIDLIREAEKAEKSPENTQSKSLQGKRFFPKDFSVEETHKSQTIDSEENGTSYFIANVESPRVEKSEVYLEIGSETESSQKLDTDPTWKKTLHISDINKSPCEDDTVKSVVFEV